MIFFPATFANFIPHKRIAGVLQSFSLWTYRGWCSPNYNFTPWYHCGCFSVNVVMDFQYPSKLRILLFHCWCSTIIFVFIEARSHQSFLNYFCVSMIMLMIWMYWKFRRKNESESENADFSTTLPRTLAVPEEKKPLYVVYSLLQVVCVWGDVSFIFFKPNTFVYHAYIYCETDCLLWWSYLHKENIRFLLYRFGPVAGVDRTRVLLWNTLNRY